MKARMLNMMFFVLAMSLAGASHAIDSNHRLKHNPFSKPKVMTEPPKPVVKKVEPEEPEVLPHLRATLVSEHAPMVLVEDALLEIGEEIDGFRLRAVDEGSAVFERRGKQFTLWIEVEEE